ncbi:BQ2448_5151 [Microbotryum intermedium]|uniref:BQ2448_5151 protein n=1 Tax=Microbotryum intermedium TaxID=269621 RepID=A0A238F087_9BASI|nr:BQ2448_5151 [Microbotryum intermedium]
MEPVAYVDSPFAHYLDEAGIDEHAGLETSPIIAIGEPAMTVRAFDADIDSPGRSKSRGSPSTPRRRRSGPESGDECIKFALSTSSLLTPRLKDALASYPAPSHQTLSVNECSVRAATVVWEIRQSPSALGPGNAFTELWQQAGCTARRIGLSIRSFAPPISASRALPTPISVETAYTMADMTRLFDRLICASQDFDRHAAQLVRSLRPAIPYSDRTQQQVVSPLVPRLIQPNRVASAHSKILALMQEMTREYESALMDSLFCALGAASISDPSGGSETTTGPNLCDGVFGGIHRANSIARRAGVSTGRHRARPSVGAEGVFGVGTAARSESPRAVKLAGRRSLSPRRRPSSWSLEYTLPPSDLFDAMPSASDDTLVEGRETKSEEDLVQNAFSSAHGARRLWLLSLTAIIGVPPTRLNRLASHVGSMTMTLRQKVDQLVAWQSTDKPRMLSTTSPTSSSAPPSANSLPPWNGHDFAPPSTQSPVAVSLTQLEVCRAAMSKLLQDMEVQMTATVDEARRRLGMDSNPSPAALLSCHDSVRVTMEMLLRNYHESRLILRQMVPHAAIGTHSLTEFYARPKSPAAVEECDTSEVDPAILASSASTFEHGDGLEPLETGPSHAESPANSEVEQIFEAIVPASLRPLRSTMTREERLRVKRDQRVSEPLVPLVPSEVRLIGELKGVLEARRKPLKARNNE